MFFRSITKLSALVLLASVAACHAPQPEVPVNPLERWPSKEAQQDRAKRTQRPVAQKAPVAQAAETPVSTDHLVLQQVINVVVGEQGKVTLAFRVDDLEQWDLTKDVPHALKPFKPSALLLNKETGTILTFLQYPNEEGDTLGIAQRVAKRFASADVPMLNVDSDVATYDVVGESKRGLPQLGRVAVRSLPGVNARLVIIGIAPTVDNAKPGAADAMADAVNKAARTLFVDVSDVGAQ